LGASIFVGEFAREQLAQHVGDGPSALEGRDLDAATLFRRNVDGEPRGEEAGFRFAPKTALPACAPTYRRCRDAQ
jgi:hypothetical protein